jgi:hypothetical protein
MDDDETVTFENVVCKRATDVALLVVIDGKNHWLPQSHVHDDSEVFDAKDNARGKLVLTRWICEQRDLI